MNFFSFILLAATAWFYYVSASKLNNYPLYMDDAFKSYVSRFNDEMAIRGKSYDLTQIKISFGNLDGQIASCYYGVKYFKVIKVDKRWWKKLTIEEKEATIFHELGHCVLRRRLHHDVLNKNGCPESLMHSSHSLKDCYFKNRTKYLDELFLEM